ncbi:cytochrome c biogenesis protein ResB [Candidatus Acidulodesulfobacterium sp. H_13]|uniref:cytochrome c biogenesis protein ResB n=1 Tax=Candidatus Acidulodesulfobacterium sp. H_13 TaxID=3395470 RepID=UPI003AF838E9
MFSKLNNFFSSVKLAVFIFITIGSVSMIGTFIDQGNTMSRYKIIYGAKVFSVLYWLGFLNVYDSWYFILLVALLIINLIMASVNTFPRTLKSVFGPYPSFKEIRDKKNPKAVYESFESGKGIKETIGALNGRLGAPVINKTDKSSRETELYYSKNSILRFSPYIAHLSIIIIIIGVLLNAKYGFRSYTNIKVNERTNISYLLKNNKPIKLPFVIRLDKYKTEYYPDGITKAYVSTISIINREHINVLTKDIKVNHPLTYDGITLYQASYGHYKPTAAKILILNLKNSKYKKVVYAQFGKFYDTGIGNVKFKFVPYKNPKRGEIPFFIKLGNKRILNFIPLSLKNYSTPLILTKYDDMAFLYEGVRNYYYSGFEITKNSYVGIIWIGSVILIISLFFSFFFNQREVWVRLINLKDGKKFKVEILAIPKKKFESFYKNFNKKTDLIKKALI